MRFWGILLPYGVLRDVAALHNEENWKTPPFEVICTEQYLRMRLDNLEHNLTAVSNGYTIYRDVD